MTGGFAHHGGRLTEARATFGGETADWLDLSTGINPNPWALAPADAIDWQALPDPADLVRLEATAAAYFGGDPALCLAVPGSETALRLLGRILDLPGRHLPLCYGTHVKAFARALPYDPEAAAAGSTPAVLVLGNPNNPDGAVLDRDAVMAALDRQERSGGWLIVDEAFADCAPHASVAGMVADARRLIVTRSFGKFFGLAGVRLGFVLAPRAVLSGLRQLQGEWPICAAGLSMGLAAYADAQWIARQRSELGAAAARLDGVLMRHGLTPGGHCPLFRLVETTDALHLFDALARRHILTRPFARHPSLLRFGLPADDTALARLDAALAETRARG